MDLNAVTTTTTTATAATATTTSSPPSSSAQAARRQHQQPQAQQPSQQPQQQHPLDHAKGLHGCKHYRRRCKLVAPCCDEAFWCRHCHNERTAAGEWDPRRRHELERSAVREVVCGLCDERQPAAASCRRCGVGFGDYVCLRCCFFDDVDRGQWHCDACGICRVGGAHRFFHCETCSCCYSTSLRGNHVCVENSMRSACPVCLEYLFDSVRPTAVLPCGHTIHSECLRECERQRQLSCPVCLRSYADLGALWRRLDAEVAATGDVVALACGPDVAAIGGAGVLSAAFDELGFGGAVLLFEGEAAARAVDVARGSLEWYDAIRVELGVPRFGFFNIACWVFLSLMSYHFYLLYYRTPSAIQYISA